MPFVNLESHRLHYEISGTTGPWLMFCNSLGTDLHMWDAQVAALAGRYRILRYDRRGHGSSSAAPGDYSLADLGGDVIALLDALGIERTHFVGLSLGGLLGQYLAVQHAERLERLVVCATAMKVGTAAGWHARMKEVREHGLAPMVDATASRWFTDAFRHGHPRTVEAILDTFLSVDAEGYAGCCAALAHADMSTLLGAVKAPLLAISGDDDPVCTPRDLQSIADAVGGTHVVLRGRHLVNVESSEAFNAAVENFLVG